MRAKYIEIAELIKTRIDNGYYLAANFPGEQSLADQLGVSYMTARRAVQQLMAEKTLLRLENGRISIPENCESHKDSLRIAMLLPAYISPSYNKWWLALQNAVLNRGGTVRMIPYIDWRDPVFWEGVNGDFNCIFLVPPNNIPKLLEELLISNKRKIITLFEDLTFLGLSGIDGGDPGSISLLVDHLVALGHKTIDCLNTQPESSKIKQHISIWRKLLKEKGLTGQLHNAPVKPFTSPEVQARKIFSGLLRNNQMNSTAVYCITVAAAKGVIRALSDVKIKIGEEIAVCSFGGGEEAKMMTPSLTVVDTPDPTPVVSQALDIFFQHEENDFPKFIQPKDTELFIGESTNPK